MFSVNKIRKPVLVSVNVVSFSGVKKKAEVVGLTVVMT